MTDDLFKISPEKALDIYQTSTETWVSLSTEASAILSLYGMRNFTCSLLLLLFQGSSNEEKMCFHQGYSKEIRKSAASNVTVIGTLGSNTLRFQTRSTLWKESPAFHMTCSFHDEQSVDFTFYPLLLKSPPRAKRPSGDMTLSVKLFRHTSTMFQLDLYWDCPSYWVALPNQYKIGCSPVTNDCNGIIDEDGTTCWSANCTTNCKWTHEDWFHSVDWHEHRTTVFVDYVNFQDLYSSEINLPVVLFYNNWPKEIISFECAIQAITSDWQKGKVSQTVNVPLHENQQKRNNGDIIQLAVRTTYTVYHKNHGITKQCQIKTVLIEELHSVGWMQVGDESLEDCDEASFHDMGATMDQYLINDFLDGENKIRLPDNYISCYDWIAHWWVIFVQAKGEDQVNKQITSYASDHEFAFTLIFTANTPEQAVCLPSETAVYWSEKSDGKFELHSFSFGPQLQHVSNITPSNPLISANNCPLDVASGALDVFQNIMNPKVMFTAEDGIYALSLLNGSCIKLYDSNWLSIRSVEIIKIKHFKVLDTLYVISEGSLQQILQVHVNGYTILNNLTVERSEVEKKELVKYPGFPSHLVDTKGFEDAFFSNEDEDSLEGSTHWEISAISRLTTDASLISIPHGCFFTTITSIDIEYISETTAIVSIYAAKNGSEICKVFKTRPPVWYYAHYGIMPKKSLHLQNNVQCKGNGCLCDMLNMKCSSVASSLTWHDKATLTLTDMQHDNHYLLEVGGFPLWQCISILNPLVYGEDGFLGPICNRIESEIEYKLTNSGKTFVKTFHFLYVPKQIGPNYSMIYGIGITLAIILTLLMIMLAVFFKHRWHIYQKLPYINVQQITWLQQIGEGQFGSVWEANIRRRMTTEGQNTTVTRVKNITQVKVAIKLLKETANEKEKRQFLEEALVLSKLNCAYIIKPLGICISKPVVLVLEFLNGGSVQDFLRKGISRNSLKFINLLHMAIDVCRACKYLEENGFIHRDISAKNCLVQLAVGSLIKVRRTKLADFGLAKNTSIRNVYKTVAEVLLPIPYTSPEGLQGSFSSKSDVYSFGVLLWEIFTWCADPYGQCYFKSSEKHACPLRIYSMAEVQMLVLIVNKNLKDLPYPCTTSMSESLKAAITICCNPDQEQRPTFKEMEKNLTTMITEKEVLQKGFPVIFEPDDIEDIDDTTQYVTKERSRRNSATPAYSAIKACFSVRSSKNVSVDSDAPLCSLTETANEEEEIKHVGNETESVV